MKNADPHPLLKRLSRGLLINVAVFCLLLITTATTWASVGKISDAAGVLKQSQVKNAATSIGYPVDIYTTTNFSGTSSQFEQRARDHLTNPNQIVMAISQNPRYIAVVAGSKVPLSSAQASSAVDSFKGNYQNSGGDFTSATVGALQSLQSAVGNGSTSNNTHKTNPTPAAGGGISNCIWCLLGLLALGAVALFAIKRPRMGGLPFGRPPYNRPYDGPYQRNYPPDQGPGYPPQQGGYPSQQGMNPFAAGGLGAAAGGFLGYELGRQQSEREAGQDQGAGGGSVGDFGEGSGGGSVGGFGGDDSGGGSVGGFGGDDSGGGNVGGFGGDDSGGGNVGDFGGDDSGGGSVGGFGGDDSGGGSSGNF